MGPNHPFFSHFVLRKKKKIFLNFYKLIDHQRERYPEGDTQREIPREKPES